MRDIPWRMVWITASLATIDHGFRPLAGYRALDLGASASEVALLAAAFAVGAVLLAVPAGRVVDRVGAGRVLAVTGVVAPLPVAGALLVQSIGGLLAVAVLFGCVQLLLVVSTQAAVVGHRGVPALDVTFGWLSAGTSVGQAAGPMLALGVPSLMPNGAAGGLYLLTALSCVVACGAAISGIRLIPHSRRHRGIARRPTPVAGIVRTPGMGVAVVLSGVTLACLDLLVVFLPLWAQERGIAPAMVAAVLIVRGVASLASRVTMHVLVDRFTRKSLISGSLLVGGAGIGMLPFVGLVPALVVMAAVGFCLGLVQPLTMTWVVSSVAATDRGAALGLRMLANRVLQVAMPLAISTISIPLSGIGSPSTRTLALSAASLLSGSLVSMRSPWRYRP